MIIKTVYKVFLSKVLSRKLLSMFEKAPLTQSKEYLHAATSFVMVNEPTSTANVNAREKAISVNELLNPTISGASLVPHGKRNNGSKEYLLATTSFVMVDEPTSTANANAREQAISVNERLNATVAGASLVAHGKRNNGYVEPLRAEKIADLLSAITITSLNVCDIMLLQKLYERLLRLLELIVARRKCVLLGFKISTMNCLFFFLSSGRSATDLYFPGMLINVPIHSRHAAMWDSFLFCRLDAFYLQCSITGTYCSLKRFPVRRSPRHACSEEVGNPELYTFQFSFHIITCDPGFFMCVPRHTHFAALPRCFFLG